MGAPRQLPLFRADVPGGSWNERMLPGEYAVHYSSFDAGVAPFCTVLEGLDAAEAYAREQVVERPTLRCTIYDHHGLIGAPLRSVEGSAYKAKSDLSPRFRRWVGSILFFGGMLLISLDWSTDFRLSWPAMIGTRMILPGLLLLFIEAMVMLHARLDRRSASGRASP